MATDLTPRARARKRKPETRLGLVRRARRINRDLAELYPDAHTELDFTSPLELLVATILSAQTTDLRVNLVTPRCSPGTAPPDYAAADRARSVEKIIQPTGFFRAKTTASSACRPGAVRPVRRRGAAAG